jgi:hypothetical protein
MLLAEIGKHFLKVKQRIQFSRMYGFDQLYTVLGRYRINFHITSKLDWFLGSATHPIVMVSCNQNAYLVWQVIRYKSNPVSCNCGLAAALSVIQSLFFENLSSCLRSCHTIAYRTSVCQPMKNITHTLHSIRWHTPGVR